MPDNKREGIFKDCPYLKYILTSSDDMESSYVFQYDRADLSVAFHILKEFHDKNDNVTNCCLSQRMSPMLAKQSIKTKNKDAAGKIVYKDKEKIKESSAWYVNSYDWVVRKPKLACAMRAMFYDDGYPFEVQFEKVGNDIILSSDGNILFTDDNRESQNKAIEDGWECVLKVSCNERGQRLATIFAEEYAKQMAKTL